MTYERQHAFLPDGFRRHTAPTLEHCEGHPPYTSEFGHIGSSASHPQYTTPPIAVEQVNYDPLHGADHETDPVPGSQNVIEAREAFMDADEDDPAVEFARGLSFGAASQSSMTGYAPPGLGISFGPEDAPYLPAFNFQWNEFGWQAPVQTTGLGRGQGYDAHSPTRSQSGGFGSSRFFTPSGIQSYDRDFPVYDSTVYETGSQSETGRGGVPGAPQMGYAPVFEEQLWHVPEVELEPVSERAYDGDEGGSWMVGRTRQREREGGEDDEAQEENGGRSQKRRRREPQQAFGETLTSRLLAVQALESTSSSYRYPQ